MENCRSCAAPLGAPFLDLGNSPLSNSYLKQEQLVRVEPTYPLLLHVCPKCFLMQLDVFEKAEKIFSHEYAYFSSFSDAWLDHCKRYTEMMIQRFNIDKTWQIIEVASNDGYLLQYFHARQIPVLGIEPAYPCAFESLRRGIPTEAVYLTKKYAESMAAKGLTADLIIGNNVLAHNPEINDFISAMKVLLKPHGLITMEFPHVMQMVKHNEFDTIYHEHFSYISLHAAKQLFASNGFEIFDVEELPTHGGSLRIYVHHSEDEHHKLLPSVQKLEEKEREEEMFTPQFYSDFAGRIRKVKCDLLQFLIEQKARGRKIAGYGAPAKGNTLLNYCGIRTDFIDFTVDKSPHKQGLFLPGSHIPIYGPEKLKEAKPDLVFILPWNIKEEIMRQTSYVHEWGGKWFVAIPELMVPGD